MTATPTDDEIWALVNGLINQGPQIASALADYFGGELKRPNEKLKVSRRSKQLLVNQIRRTIEIQREVSLIKKEELVRASVRRRVRNRFNQLLRLWSGSIPAGEDALLWQKWFFWWQTQPPENLKFVQKTHYKLYHASLLSLAKSLYYAGKRIHVESFLADYDLSPDARATVQSLFARRLTRKFTEINKVRRLDRRTIVRVADFCHILSGMFEKSASVLVGLVELDRQGTLVSFADVKRRQLNTNLKTLRDDGRFEDLLDAFDKTIRNSLAHATWSVSPSKRLITFHDLAKHVELSFEQFLRKTRELAAAVLALIELRSFFLYVQFDYYNRTLSLRGTGRTPPSRAQMITSVTPNLQT